METLAPTHQDIANAHAAGLLHRHPISFSVVDGMFHLVLMPRDELFGCKAGDGTRHGINPAVEQQDIHPMCIMDMVNPSKVLLVVLVTGMRNSYTIGESHQVDIVVHVVLVARKNSKFEGEFVKRHHYRRIGNKELLDIRVNTRPKSFGNDDPFSPCGKGFGDTQIGMVAVCVADKHSITLPRDGIDERVGDERMCFGAARNKVNSNGGFRGLDDESVVVELIDFASIFAIRALMKS